ncbi:hypothetical protein RHMOL_Rhmol10G0042900 [Rhododendron molle]|uniref:Uncharacterized protein n=1 Tax=Rhododendron molle TaxID=49168 RepID=A0ACC0LZS7_RHOML|nr:hypothetical protein RHMOL_Rhmol10G0042900 [Rhododendron molle]
MILTPIPCGGKKNGGATATHAQMFGCTAGPISPSTVRKTARMKWSKGVDITLNFNLGNF